MIESPPGLASVPGVVGVGIDVVDLDRFRSALARTPRFAQRVFTAGELRVDGQPRGAASLAARFAAKEAVLKALRLGIFDVALHDIEVTGGRDEPPGLLLHSTAAAAAAGVGVGRWLLSVTHDGGVAAAVAVGMGL